MSELRPPRFEGTIHLTSGRQLGFAEFGPVTGRPLIWFHATPGARRQIAPEAHAAAHERDVRIIVVERPGIGASTPHLYNALVEWAADIEELSNALDIGHFGVAGLSGGGPYALACAHEMPGRVVAAAVLGGVAPSLGPDAAKGGASGLVRYASPILRYLRAPINITMRTLIRVLEPVTDQAVNLATGLMPPGDQRVFDNIHTRRMFCEDLQHGSRDQMQAMVFDGVLFGREWGFSLGDIKVPVHMWYGDADNIVPVEHGRHIAARIPGSTLRIRPEEGHLGGLGASHEILDAILGHFPTKAWIAEKKTG